MPETRPVLDRGELRERRKARCPRDNGLLCPVRPAVGVTRAFVGTALDVARDGRVFTRDGRVFPCDVAGVRLLVPLDDDLEDVEGGDVP